MAPSDLKILHLYRPYWRGKPSHSQIKKNYQATSLRMIVRVSIVPLPFSAASCIVGLKQPVKGEQNNRKPGCDHTSLNLYWCGHIHHSPTTQNFCMSDLQSLMVLAKKRMQQTQIISTFLTEWTLKIGDTDLTRGSRKVWPYGPQEKTY